jgi:hypothetical protein
MPMMQPAPVSQRALRRPSRVLAAARMRKRIADAAGAEAQVAAGLADVRPGVVWRSAAKPKRG